jgi:hypothetical protein
MRSWPVRIALIAIVGTLIATGLPGIREWLAVDACLDAGGVYDYQGQRCRADIQTLPVRSSPVFRAPDAGSLIVALGVAIAMARLFVTLDRRANARAAAA